MGEKIGNSPLKLISSRFHYCAANLPYFYPHTYITATLSHLRSSESPSSMNSSFFECILSTWMPVMCPRKLIYSFCERDTSHPIQSNPIPFPALIEHHFSNETELERNTIPCTSQRLTDGRKKSEKKNNKLTENLLRSLSNLGLMMVA